MTPWAYASDLARLGAGQAHRVFRPRSRLRPRAAGDGSDITEREPAFSSSASYRPEPGVITVVHEDLAIDDRVVVAFRTPGRSDRHRLASRARTPAAAGVDVPGNGQRCWSRTWLVPLSSRGRARFPGRAGGPKIRLARPPLRRGANRWRTSVRRPRPPAPPDGPPYGPWSAR